MKCYFNKKLIYCVSLSFPYTVRNQFECFTNFLSIFDTLHECLLIWGSVPVRYYIYHSNKHFTVFLPLAFFGLEIYSPTKLYKFLALIDSVKILVEMAECGGGRCNIPLVLQELDINFQSGSHFLLLFLAYPSTPPPYSLFLAKMFYCT